MNTQRTDQQTLPGAELDIAKMPGHWLLARFGKREDLLCATEKQLEKIKASVAKGRLKGQDDIGVRVGRVINQYKMAKHFLLDIRDDAFNFERKTHSIETEARLDGLYIIRTSVPAELMDAAIGKATTGKLADGTPAHSFSTLLAELSTIVRNTCLAALPGESTSTFGAVTSANPKQQRALDLLQTIAL